jgi:hypothetical protein
MKNAILWDIKTQSVPYRRNITSLLEPHRLVLYKIFSFHGGDYEECRLLGYKNPFRTSQGTHYFSTTESSQLMLCKICSFHGDDYEECRRLGCSAVWALLKPMFRPKRRFLQDPHAVKIRKEGILLLICLILSRGLLGKVQLSLSVTN